MKIGNLQVSNSKTRRFCLRNDFRENNRLSRYFHRALLEREPLRYRGTASSKVRPAAVRRIAYAGQVNLKKKFRSSGNLIFLQIAYVNSFRIFSLLR